jgi:regulator of PEP synthase PpsR (kinase-PPPase family)
MEEAKKIAIISDGTGKTAKRLMDAILVQYAEKEVDYSLKNIYAEVRTKKRLNEVLSEINGDYLVILSLIAKDLSTYCCEALDSRGIIHLNILEPLLSTMSKFLGVHPDYKPGLLHVVDDRYYRRIDSIGYTVEHDDGRGQHLDQAELVLLGVSRTCKTPISMYISCNYGMKVANIPIIWDQEAAERLRLQLAKLPRHIIFGLTMTADVLSLVREERSYGIIGNSHGRSELEDYYDPRTIRYEVNFALEFFEENHIEVIDVTRRAIEEVSEEIIKKIKRMV